jgi:hypothetical protein
MAKKEKPKAAEIGDFISHRADPNSVGRVIDKKDTWISVDWLEEKSPNRAKINFIHEVVVRG